MSVPCPAEPQYTVQTDTPRALSLCPGVKEGEKWCFATGTDTTYKVGELSHTDESATALLICRFSSGKAVKSRYTVSKNGVSVSIDGAGEIAFSLPAFEFDGETHTEITTDEHTLQIRYEGWVCRYVTDGRIIDLNSVAENRNGRYRAFSAIGKEHLGVHIEILKEA
jgi:hypothetical protein